MPRLSGYFLLPSGRERHAALLASIRADIGAAGLDALSDLYLRFEPLNDDFKRLCTRWQLHGGSPNDHSDPHYDEGCIADLEDLHSRFLPVALRAGRAVSHFVHYADRFRAALRRLTDGDRDYFTKPLIDSYHTIWMEFHEDLIATLGRERQAHEA
jgi:hypothetical protein